MIILIKTGPGLPSVQQAKFSSKKYDFQTQLNLQSNEDIVNKLDPDDGFSFSNIELLLACLSTLERQKNEKNATVYLHR